MTALLSPPKMARRPVHGSPIRVCFLIDDLGVAGTETQLLALIRHLDRSRVQPFLCLLRGGSPLSQALEPEDCPVLRLGVRSLRSPQTLAAAWRLRRFLQREGIDILQAYFPDSTYLGVPVARWARVPVVVRTRNNVGHWLTPFHRLLGRLLNPLTTATIANCDAARDALLQAENPRPESVIVLENGVDLERFEDVPPLKNGPLRRIGVVANLRQVKGLDVFINAAARVVRELPDATFRIAGEGPEREALQDQARRLGLRLEMCGAVEDIPRFLSGIDVAVQSSRAEGMSNAVLEYMAASRGIVATSVGANPRLIDHGVHGLLVPPDDPERLAEAILELLREPTRTQRLADAAHQRVETAFSRRAMVRRFEEFYRRLRLRSEE